MRYPATQAALGRVRYFMAVVLATLMPLVALAGNSIDLFGAAKYDAHFAHFDYVNANAPKGGTLTLAVATPFDKLNPFSLRGRPAPGITRLFFAPLAA